MIICSGFKILQNLLSAKFRQQVKVGLPIFLFAASVAIAQPVVAPIIAPAVTTPNLEALLVKSLVEIENNRLDSALASIESLLKYNPNFHLAQLIKGDLLLARARQIKTIGNAVDGQPERLADLRDEAKVRLQRYREVAALDAMPKYLLQLPPEQQYAVLVDTTKSRLYLFRNVNGEPRYVNDYYISIGKKGAEKNREGDQKTPIGVYHITASLPKNKLSDFYGSGAYPISYPNEWDKRQGRNGHGIWLHGTPSNTYSRAPRASDGCVVLTNQDLDGLGKLLQIGLTSVVISDKVEWLSRADWLIQRDTLAHQLELWRRDWESIDTERYLKNYSENFAANGQNFSDWAQLKRQVNAGKTSIKIKLSNVSIVRSPGPANLAVVTFDQDYQSNNLSNKIRKRQYWTFENQRWKIIYEGAA